MRQVGIHNAFLEITDSPLQSPRAQSQRQANWLPWALYKGTVKQSVAVIAAAIDGAWRIGAVPSDVMIDGENWSHDRHNSMF